MTRLMCLPVFSLAVWTMSPAAAAEMDEDKAKAAAVAFAKAVKSRDVDAAMKLVGTPFLMEKGKDAELIDKTTDVKAELKKVFDRVEPERVPTTVAKVIPAGQVGEAFKEKVKGRELIEKALGKDGYAVLVTQESKGESQIGFVVLVAPREKEMKVVGMVD